MRYVQYKDGQYRHGDMILGDSLAIRIKDIRQRIVRWDDHGFKIAERGYQKGDAILEGYVHVCDLCFDMDGVEYLLSISGNAVKKVLIPYYKDLRDTGDDIFGVITKISVSFNGRYRQICLECVADEDSRTSSWT